MKVLYDKLTTKSTMLSRQQCMCPSKRIKENCNSFSCNHHTRIKEFFHTKKQKNKKPNNAIYIILLNHRKAVFSHFRFVFTYMSKPVKSCLKPFREHTHLINTASDLQRVKSLVTHCIQYK